MRTYFNFILLILFFLQGMLFTSASEPTGARPLVSRHIYHDEKKNIEVCPAVSDDREERDIRLIPYPNKLVRTEGYFEMETELTVSLAEIFRDELKYLQPLFGQEYHIRMKEEHKGELRLVYNKKIREKEGYRLKVRPGSVILEASTSAGAFWGIQTLRQLLQKSDGSYRIPACEIEDHPAYSWRAFMLDESRYFKGSEVVKKLLDEMALLKMNIFHWHLTDDQGWRIEIRKYPLLTAIGSKRDSTQIGTWPGGWSRNDYDGIPHEGFYTQAQIGEILDYARERHITVVPEFEIPGHASAAIAAYPWLGTTGDSIHVPGKFGVHYEVFDVTSSRVEGFIQDVLDELMALFPSPVIHIGGDEVKYDYWEQSPSVNQFMKANHIATYADLQVWFTNIISNYIGQKGRRMMGWNEIMGTPLHDFSSKGGEVKERLAENAIVHFWKGDVSLINDAVSKGHEVVNSFHEYTYMDYSYDKIPLEKAYSFHPTPDGITDSSKILGLGCQMWSEWIPTASILEYQVFPRLAAYAEVGWTEDGQKDFARFREALSGLEKIWRDKGINYYPGQ